MPPITTNPTINYAENRRKLLIVAIISFAIFLVVAVALAIINSYKTATIEIVVAPSTATVKIDGRKFKTSETAKYYPGSYTAEISAPGFIAQSLPLELSAGETSPLFIVLEPAAENSDFYEKNPAESSRRQAVYDANFQFNSDAYLARYPIVAVLPYELSTSDRFGDPTGYRIDYGQFDGCKSDFCLQVTGYLKSNLDEAKNYLRSKGFNPDDYQILFNYTPVAKAKPEDFPENIRQIMQDAGYFDN